MVSSFCNQRKVITANSSDSVLNSILFCYELKKAFDIVSFHEDSLIPCFDFLFSQRFFISMVYINFRKTKL